MIYWEGTNGNDIKDGTDANETFVGLGGDDQLTGKGGQDVLKGEDGNDRLYGEDGIDFLVGGNGDDSLYGGNDSDYLYGEAGSDLLVGGAGDDIFYFNVIDRVDTISDFNSAEGDRIVISSAMLGATSKNEFSFDATNSSLYFKGQQFAILENITSFNVDTELLLW